MTNAVPEPVLRIVIVLKDGDISAFWSAVLITVFVFGLVGSFWRATR